MSAHVGDQSSWQSPVIRKAGSVRGMIGLPEEISVCLFDLDGVLTRTAELHREAWKQTFDAFLRKRDGENFQPFTEHDYTAYVDGRPRADGVRERAPLADAVTVVVGARGTRGTYAGNSRVRHHSHVGSPGTTSRTSPSLITPP